jgi:hypothetical protein
MTDLLITLMGASGRLQRTVAFGLLALVVILAGSGTGVLLNWVTVRASNIRDMRVELFRLEQVIARTPSTDSTRDIGGEAAGLFLQGLTLPVIQAGLQERVNASADRANATVASISGTAPLQLGGATYVGVRAELEGGLQAFHAVVRDLETSDPPLLVHEASIRSTNDISMGDLKEPLQLAGQLVIYGAVDPASALSREGNP